MKIKIVNKFGYIEDEFGIEVNEEDLQQIGLTKCFDVENNKIINFDNSYILKTIEYTNKIGSLQMKLDKTDYVANKLAEAITEYIVTEDKTKLVELHTKYTKELADREEWRKEVNDLQDKLKALEQKED